MKDQIEALTRRDATAVYAGAMPFYTRQGREYILSLDRVTLQVTIDYPQGHHDYQMTSFFALEY